VLELLAPAAIERACGLIHEWSRNEQAKADQDVPPAVALIATEIADLESLIEARPARAVTLRPLIEELTTKQTNLQRMARRKNQSAEEGSIPAAEAYRAAVAEMAATLHGVNVEATRAAVRQHVGSIPVFMQDGNLYGRLGIDPAAILRVSNQMALAAW
jgi:hypothetical protein